MKRVLVVLLLQAFAATGCQTIKNIFNDVKKENIEPPTPLVEIAPAVQMQKLWQERIGSGAAKSGVRVSPAVVDGKFVRRRSRRHRFYAPGRLRPARRCGAVASRQASRIYLASTATTQRNGLVASASDGKLLVVGSLEGAVQAFDATTGDERYGIRRSHPKSRQRPPSSTISSSCAPTMGAYMASTLTTARVNGHTNAPITRD